jgi:beta-glucosidase
MEGRSAKKQAKLLQNADAVIYVGGEKPYTEFRGNITDLSLEQKQLDELAYVSENTDKLILVLVEGRPRLITEVVMDIEAVLFAGLPGFMGADAIANIISGDVNPNGKLSFSYPLFENHHIAYNHKPGAVNHYSSDEANAILQGEGKPIALYPFGHGLSYTSFEYSDLKLSAASMMQDEMISAEVTVTNTGDLTGQESVLWFLRDKVGYITRPVALLKHFEKIELQPGASATVSFEIDRNDLWYPDEQGKQRLESGEFIVKVGGLEKTFNLNVAQNQ